MHRAICFAAVIFLGAGVALPAWAASKAMTCDRYQIGTDGLKTSIFTYTTAADYATDTVAVTLIKEPKENQAGTFPLPIKQDWKIVWQSQDRMRVVALTENNTKNPFDSPVVMVDLDFANVRMQYQEAGGLIDFVTVVSDPWKYECKRLD